MADFWDNGGEKRTAAEMSSIILNRSHPAGLKYDEENRAPDGGTYFFSRGEYC